MTPVRQCVMDIIAIAVTGMDVDEIEAMQRRIEAYLKGVPEKDRQAAENTLLDVLKKASAEMDISEAAEALLDHAVLHVEQGILQRGR